jgi:uncharacterized protein (TIGR03437 family)
MIGRMRVAKRFSALSFWPLFVAAALCGQTGPGGGSVAVTLTVEGRANIFAAGRPSAFDGVLPPSLSFARAPGSVITFSGVTGLVGTASAPQIGPDGVAGSTDIDSYEGIAGIIHRGRVMFLVGVFLDDSVPRNPAPPRLDFTGQDSFETLSPLPGQTFFVGDGLTGTGLGKKQRFNVPASATRLFLGIADAADFYGAPSWYWDNTGAFTATVELSGAGALAIATTSLPDGALEKTYSHTLQVAGGTPPYRWSVSAGSLPPGLSLSPSTGTISGTPILAGTFRFTVQVVDAAGVAAAQALTITVPEGRECTPEPTSMDIAYGDLITCRIDPAGDTDLFRFAGSAGETIVGHVVRLDGAGQSAVRVIDPQGTVGPWNSYGRLAFIEMKLTQTGTYVIQVADHEHNETLAYALTLERVIPPSPSATPVCFGTKFESEINPAADLDLCSFDGITGDLISATLTRLSGAGQPCMRIFAPDQRDSPAWVCGSVSSSIDLKLTASGAHAIEIAADQHIQPFAYRLEVQCIGRCQAALPPLAIATASPLPNGAVGTGYSQTLAASGGAPPYRWSVTGGTLPPGLSVNASTGALSGTPSSAGTFTFTVQVTDSAGATAIKSFSLTISGATLSVGRSALLFTYLVGDPPPAAQTVSLSSSGSSVNFTAAASTTSGGNWLLVNPPSGATPATLSVLVNPAGLGVGIYSGTVTVTASGATNSPQRVEIQLFVNRPDGPPQVFSLVNGASMKTGAVAPGEIVTFFGSNLGPASLMNLQLNEAGQVATSLGEVQVTFDSIPAPLLYVQANQLSAIVPYAVGGTAQAKVEVQYKGAKSNTVLAQVTASAPGIFAIDASGKGQGAILNQNYTVNSAANPAEKGSVVMVYATGEGETDPQVADGRFTSPEALPKPKLPVSVKIGGLDAEVLYAGGAPGSVAGLLQVNVRVPLNVASGNGLPLVVTVGAASSQEGVTMAVR